jgi:hypothetical protein
MFMNTSFSELGPKGKLSGKVGELDDIAPLEVSTARIFGDPTAIKDKRSVRRANEQLDYAPKTRKSQEGHSSLIHHQEK